MSEELRVKLLGSPAAFVGEEPVSGFVSVKAQALLFYLAATGETHRRDALASLLWSDIPDTAARKNLRDVLSNLRQLIGPFLLITRQEVGLNPNAPAIIDSQVLSGTLSAVRDTDAGPPTNAVLSLAEIADPRMGEFLDGFCAPDAPLFEEWMLAERARLQWELGNALERLTEHSLSAGDYYGAGSIPMVFTCEPVLSRKSRLRHSQCGWSANQTRPRTAPAAPAFLADPADTLAAG